MLLIALPFVCWQLQPKPQKAADPYGIPTDPVALQVMVLQTADAIVKGTEVAPMATKGPPGFFVPSAVPTRIPATATATARPLFVPTAGPRATATVASVSINTPVPGEYALSFYDPHLRADFPALGDDDPNCADWNPARRDCVSKVHNGQDDYWLWYGKGAACPADLPIDAVFEVLQPAELAGVWRCIDRGDLDQYKYGRWWHYIDFMLDYPEMIWTGPNLDAFPWSSTVRIKVLSVP